MSLEELLEKAKKAHQEKKQAPDGAPRVVGLPTKGRITSYDKVPEEEIRRAREHHQEKPEDAEAHVYLAFLLYASENFDEAIAHFQSLLEQGFRVANQHFYLGNCHYKKGDHLGARRHWQLSLEASPPEGIARLVKRRLEWVRDAS